MNPAGTATLVLSILAAALSAQAQYELIHLGSAAGGYGLDIAVAGHYAFLASYTGGLRVYDISDPRNPIFIAATNSGIPYVYDRNITIAGDFAYTGAGRDTNFHVYNISAPTRPVPVAKIFSGNYVSQIAVTGTVGYVANTAEGFSVYDFSNPSMPTQVTNFAGTRATCVTVQGGYAYVGSDHRFQIFSSQSLSLRLSWGKRPHSIALRSLFPKVTPLSPALRLVSRFSMWQSAFTTPSWSRAFHRASL